MTQAHVEPLPIPPIKSKLNNKSDKGFVKLKLRRDPTSATSDIYDFKMALFDNGHPDEFLLFVQNFDMTLAASGTLAMVTKNQYICTLVRGELLRHFYSLSADM